MGLPVTIDDTKDPPEARGIGSWLMLFYFNGSVMAYEGSYWRALWHWLFKLEP